MPRQRMTDEERKASIKAKNQRYYSSHKEKWQKGDHNVTPLLVAKRAILEVARDYHDTDDGQDFLVKCCEKLSEMSARARPRASSLAP